MPFGDGGSGTSVFFFPGACGNPAEIARVAEKLSKHRKVYGVYLSDRNRDDASNTIERIAELAIVSIRRAQPTGPYALAGYSFGGLVALAATRQLQDIGESVIPPILIDCYPDPRFWPLGAWLKARMRRVCFQIGSLFKLPPLAALTQFGLRCRAFALRLLGRFGFDKIAPQPAGTSSAFNTNVAAAAKYCPTRDVPRLFLIQSMTERHFGCSSEEIWRRFCCDLMIERVTGDHLSLMRDPSGVEAVATVINRYLETAAIPEAPNALVVTTQCWHSTARLAVAMAESGFGVGLFCPAAHPAHQVKGKEQLRVYRLPIRRRRAALRNLLAATAPKLVLACDEPALELVCSVQGRQSDFAKLTSRSEIIQLAETQGLRVPRTAQVSNFGDVDRWIDENGFPVILKTDASWGGAGVAVIRDKVNARKYLKRLFSRPNVAKALKRAVIDGDFELIRDWLKGKRPVVNIQNYVEGPRANIAVACWQGKVLATIPVQVLEETYANGPACVVRVINHSEMEAAAKTLVDSLNLSGLCGFDFIIDKTGGASLIELNPRATPTCHLNLPPANNLTIALRACFGGNVPKEPSATLVNPVIALHPGAQPDQIARWDAFHDRPDYFCS